LERTRYATIRAESVAAPEEPRQAPSLIGNRSRVSL